MKLFLLQVVQHQELTQLAERSWDREIPFSTPRGQFLDRNGKVIVSNMLAPTLYYMPSQNKDIEKIAQLLTDPLQAEKQKLLTKLRGKAYIIKLSQQVKIFLFSRQKNLTIEYSWYLYRCGLC